MNAFRRLTITVFAAACALAAHAEIHDPRALNADPATADEPIAPTLTGLGDYSFDGASSKSASRKFFDQGLRLTYAYNHSEALRAFKEAARLDPDNAMAYWGWALVLGPNLNLPMLPDVNEQANMAMQMALDRRGKANAKERAFIDALATRYSSDNDRASLDKAYADAMRALHERFPDDLDAATLYGASLMNLSPWDYWHRDGVPYERTKIFLEIFEKVLARDQQHPGALHYYIHAVEAHQAGRGEAAADALRDLMPSAGHMQHMPSHIYMRLGRYADGYAVNVDAAKADENYIAQCRAQGLYPVGYYPHNMHFLVWAATLQGRSEVALDHARTIRDDMPEFLELAGDVPAAVAGDAWRIHEHFRSQYLYTLVRFGRWDDILNETAPPESARFMTGIWHYARGLAHLYKGNEEAAAEELDALSGIIDEDGMSDYWINASLAINLLQIASELLDGEIHIANQRYRRGIDSLELAVRLQDGLAYTEPPDWYFPTRHFLGAALLAAGRPAEAETVYWDDLRKTPENGYALLGLAQAMSAQEKDGAAATIQNRFNAAWKDADVALTSSKF